MNDKNETPPATPFRRLRAPQTPATEQDAPRRGAPPPAGAGRVERLPESEDDEVSPRGDTAPREPEVFSLADVDDLEARDGDVLVVTYPEVTLPTSTKFLMVKVGGSIYTRRLVKGESVREQFEKVYRFLAAASERTARAKLALYVGEMSGARTRE